MDVVSLVDVKHIDGGNIEVHENDTRAAPQLVDQHLGHISVMHWLLEDALRRASLCKYEKT